MALSVVLGWQHVARAMPGVWFQLRRASRGGFVTPAFYLFVAGLALGGFIGFHFGLDFARGRR